MRGTPDAPARNGIRGRRSKRHRPASTDAPPSALSVASERLEKLSGQLYQECKDFLSPELEEYKVVCSMTDRICKVSMNIAREAERKVQGVRAQSRKQIQDLEHQVSKLKHSEANALQKVHRVSTTSQAALKKTKDALQSTQERLNANEDELKKTKDALQSTQEELKANEDELKKMRDIALICCANSNDLEISRNEVKRLQKELELVKERSQHQQKELELVKKRSQQQQKETQTAKSQIKQLKTQAETDQVELKRVQLQMASKEDELNAVQLKLTKQGEKTAQIRSESSKALARAKQEANARINDLLQNQGEKVKAFETKLAEAQSVIDSKTEALVFLSRKTIDIIKKCFIPGHKSSSDSENTTFDKVLNVLESRITDMIRVQREEDYFGIYSEMQIRMKSSLRGHTLRGIEKKTMTRDELFEALKEMIHACLSRAPRRKKNSRVGPKPRKKTKQNETPKWTDKENADPNQNKPKSPYSSTGSGEKMLNLQDDQSTVLPKIPPCNEMPKAPTELHFQPGLPPTGEPAPETSVELTPRSVPSLFNTSGVSAWKI